MSLSSLSTSKRKYGNQWDMRSPPAKRRTVSPPSSERSAASPSSMSDTLSPPLIGPRLPPGWAPTPRAPSPSSPPPPRRAPSPPSPPTNPRDLHATNNFGEGVYFQQPRQHAWDSDGEPADPGMGWTRQRLSWWNPQWVWDRAAINRPDGRYCETCPTENGEAGYGEYSRGWGAEGRASWAQQVYGQPRPQPAPKPKNQTKPEPFKPHDTWIDPEYRDDPEQQLPWRDGYYGTRQWRASKEYAHEERWTDSDPEEAGGQWPSKRPTFAGRRGAAARELFDELLELRRLKTMREEKAKLRTELEEMQRDLSFLAAKAEHVRKRAEEMERECARIEGRYLIDAAERPGHGGGRGSGP